MQIKAFLSAALAVATATAQSSNSTLTSVLSGNKNLTALVTLLGAFPDLATTLSNATNVTLLAPSNSAIELFNSSGTLAQAQQIEGLIPATLQYHVLQGMYMAANISSTPAFVPSLLTSSDFTSLPMGQVVEAVTMGDSVMFYGGLRGNATVTQADIMFNGGVIHVVDNILSVPMNVTAVATAANLTSLAGAVTSADLASTLTGLEEVTIFAPNNDAFQAIGSVTGNLSTSTLASILQYHVVNSSVLYSSDLSNTTVQTVGGDEVTITVANGTVYVNNAMVTTPDVFISNGVVHVIDEVLNPNNTAGPSNTTMTGSMSGSTASTAANAFGASSGTDVPFTSGVATPTSSIAAVQPTQTSVAASGAGAKGSSKSSSSSAAAPIVTAAIGGAALFGGAAWMANF